MQSRLRPLLARENIADLGALIDRLSRSRQSPLHQAVIDAMTTNETLWFRDGHPFTILQQSILPQLATGKPVRIWSAASSTGQEAYSISMTVAEFRRSIAANRLGPVSIVGTDISSRVVEQARRGEYEMLAMGRGMSDERLRQFFTATPGGGFRVNDTVRKGVEFKPLNLLESFRSLGRFDVVFCRNVLIYFSREDKLDILHRIHDVLHPHGVLILGASESVPAGQVDFQMEHCAPGIIYRPR